MKVNFQYAKKLFIVFIIYINNAPENRDVLIQRREEDK